MGAGNACLVCTAYGITLRALHRTINIQQTKDNISVLSISTPSGIIINSPHCSHVFTFVGGHGPRIILVTFEFVAPHINLHLYLAVLFALYKSSPDIS